MLPKTDEIHVLFVVSNLAMGYRDLGHSRRLQVNLDPPIRQGQTRYPYLCLQFPKEEEMEAEINLE
jgi:structure-specific recognition protein 1